MLGQSEITILVNPHLPSKIYQGITTEITGEGGSAAPPNARLRTADRAVTGSHRESVSAAAASRKWKTLFR
jgi:hypothetical protein